MLFYADAVLGVCDGLRMSVTCGQKCHYYTQTLLIVGSDVREMTRTKVWPHMCGAVNMLVKIMCCQYVLEARDARSRTNIHMQVEISSNDNPPSSRIQTCS